MYILDYLYIFILLSEQITWKFKRLVLLINKQINK